MAEKYEFLRTFTFDGNETKHLFQIAKVNIPFLSKDNEYYTVGNTDGKHFRSTRLGDYSLSIDGFVIKDNTGKSVSDSLDELKVLLNSDEPKQLIFDVFPDRYFSAIFSGVQEYDATNLDYTPLTLVFDVPDGLAHSIEPIGFSNTYSNTTNLMLDSEYNATYKYMKPWVEKLDEKFNNSNVVQGDFRTGIPLNFERDDKTDERWLNWNPATTIHTADLKKGDEVNFSVYAQVVFIDEENNKDYAGQVILEEWDTVKGAILKRHIVYIPKQVTTQFTEYGSVVKIENEKTNAINLQYGFRGSNLIKWSKPMISFLPPLGEIVTAPSVGAKAYSNSLEFGDYDYSGNPNLMSVIKASDFKTEVDSNVQISDVDYNSIRLASQGTELTPFAAYTPGSVSSLVSGKTYTISAKVKIEEGTTGNIDKLRIAYRKTLGGTILLSANTTGVEVGKEIIIKGTGVVNYNITDLSRFYLSIGTEAGSKMNGSVIVSDIKIEEGSTTTPYQPNLLDAPYYLSKVPLGENLIKPESQQPVTNSNYLIKTYNTKPMIKGKKYTITLEGTKPATQVFRAFFTQAIGNSWSSGDLKPVEGLANTWSVTFTAAADSHPTKPEAMIYQVPNTSLGQCTIKWLKLEEGDTRTPNIPYYKYEGIAPAPSNNPKDYHWGYSPSYINAVEYVPSGDSIDDLIKIENNGTYKAYPQINFTMNGENGLVAVLNENGNVLQFGNPEDVDGTVATRLDMGLKENFWGNKLPTNITINSGFDSVVPNFNNNPATPNLFDGGFDMTTYVDAIRPTFSQVTKEVWHGPSMLLPITAPTNNDRTGSFGVHTRFYFRNINKGERGRLEFAVNDETGANAMTFIVRDSSITNTEIVLEMWYKKKKLNQVSLDRKVFKKDFFEINMERTGKQLTWRFVQINSLNKYDNVIVDKQYKFTWNLESDDATKFTSTGVWFMRYGNTPHNPMYVTDTQVKWYNTPFFNNVKNIFQDGDNVTIDVEERAIYINGAINNELNVVGNEWEQFRLGLGTTIIQPVVSSWAHPANVNVTFRQSYL